VVHGVNWKDHNSIRPQLPGRHEILEKGLACQTNQYSNRSRGQSMVLNLAKATVILSDPVIVFNSIYPLLTVLF